MTEHTNDPFAETGITETQRAAGLNAALHRYNGLTPEQKEQSNAKTLLTDADAVARYLNDGTLPR